MAVYLWINVWSWMCFATSMKNNTQRESIKRIEAMENEPMEQKTHKNEGTKMV